MILTTLRRLVRVLIAIAALLAVLIGGLWLTNPRAARSEGWERLADMPLLRGEVASAVLGTKLYVFGGLRGFTTTADAVSVYDVERDRWEDGGTIARLHHAAAAAIEDVYVSGGARSVTDWTPSDRMHVIPAGDRPGHVETMPEGRQGHAMVAIGRELYIVGGVGLSDDTLIFDTRRERWTTGAPIPEGRDHLRAVAWDGRVWAIGGRSDEVLRRVDVYDPGRDRWTRGPSLPEPMSAMAVGVLDDELHVIGGENPDLFGGGVSDEHFVLERKARRWRQGPAPVLKVHGAGFGVSRDRLIIAGGASRQGALSVISWTPVTQSFEP